MATAHHSDSKSERLTFVKQDLNIRDNMKVGIIQQANTANIEENIKKLSASVRSLAKQGAELIVMQEKIGRASCRERV